MGKLLETLNKLRQPALRNIKQFDDHVAQKTEWTPLKRGGANFKTHKLVETAADRLEFKTTAFALVFFLIFAVIGFGLIGVSIYMLYEAAFEIDIEHAILLFMGLVFATIGTMMGYRNTRSITFDKTFSYFWRGNTSPNRDIEYSHPELFTHFNDIYALQIVAEYIRSNKNSYYSYELNLVLDDGSRMNVVDHGNLESLRADAETLSTFLNKPLWDSLQDVR